MKIVDIVREFFLFIALVLLQVLVLNKISLFSIATSFLYIYFVIKLPFHRNKFYVIITSFLMGIIIDVFLNTPGVNAAALTIVATLRSVLVPLFYPKNELDVLVPGIRNNTVSFIKYTIVMILIHHTLLFFIDSLSLFSVTETIYRILSSSLLSLILVLSLDSLFFRKGKVLG